VRSLRVLISPDKFKGSLNASAAAEALRAGWQAARPSDECRCLPIADGGEGFIDAIESTGNWEPLKVHVRGPLGKTVVTNALVCGSRAAIETSAACGLHLVPQEFRNPTKTSTFGVGELLLCAAAQNISLLYAGLGGSATIDGGYGMARALGFRFLDKEGAPIGDGTLSLINLARIVPPSKLALPVILAASDVTNPLLGKNGCTRFFGPQKGLRGCDTLLFEEGLACLAEACRRDLCTNHETSLGGGAAGGLGFGFLSFCGARIVPGFEVVAEVLQLDAHIQWADVILTGEGSLDSQSLGGKAPVALARMAKRQNKSVVCFAGVIEQNIEWKTLFQNVTSLSEIAGSSETAIKEARSYLFEASRRYAKNVFRKIFSINQLPMNY
jgi:glycerate kinase